jgi:predicted O-methyltransferase YrrM
MIFDALLQKVFGHLAHKKSANRLFLKYEEKLRLEQDNFFKDLGLNRGRAIVRLNQVLKLIYNRNYAENNGMWSEHLILFSALSDSNYPVNTILEIGTFNGETATILSALFPTSEIHTIDLSFSDILKTSMYKYETNDSKMLTKRNSNLQSLKNVNFNELNSLALINSQNKYDLIWIDGDHSYPTAAIDIANSVRLLNEDGIAVSDDVYIRSGKLQKNGRSGASLETLLSLSEANLITYTLIHKRIGFFFNFPKTRKKYLSVIQKNAKKIL